MRTRAVAFRRGRAAGGGGVHRRVVQVAVAPHRAALWQRGRQAEDFPGLGRGEPDRVLPAVPRVERPLQRATRPDSSARPSGSSVASIRRTCATTPACGSTLRPRCRRCRACWTACSWIGPRRNILRAPSDGAAMQLVIESGGVVRCIYGEEIDLAALGSPAISRASHVEPDQQGRWLADMSPVGGPLLGPMTGEAMLWRQSMLGWKTTGSPRRGSQPDVPMRCQRRCGNACQRDAGQAYQGVNQPAQHRRRTEQGCHKIELQKAHQSPVHGPNDHQCHSKPVRSFHLHVSLNK